MKLAQLLFKLIGSLACDAIGAALGAVPIMFLAGYLNEYMPFIYPLGWVQSLLPALLVCWTADAVRTARKTSESFTKGIDEEFAKYEAKRDTALLAKALADAAYRK